VGKINAVLVPVLGDDRYWVVPLKLALVVIVVPGRPPNAAASKLYTSTGAAEIL
jgi:hypothetical protein